MKRITVFLLILFVSSCVYAPRQDWVKVTETHNKIKMRGFSVKPPSAGDNWHIVQKTEGEIVFAGNNYKINSTLAIRATLAKLSPELITNEDYRRFFRQYRELNLNPERFEIINHKEKVNITNDVYCVNYHIKSKDKKAYTSAGYKSLILDIYGLTCRHPDDASYGVDVNYSERYNKNKPPQDLKRRAVSFFSTITIEKL